jgi:hypothetical protein
MSLKGAALQQQTAAVLGLAILLHYGYLSFAGGHLQCLTSLVAETLASQTWPVEVGRLVPAGSRAALLNATIFGPKMNGFNTKPN